MPFKNNVFISYRHLDNRSGDLGWINDFYKRLTSQLSEKLGVDDPKVWFDREIRASEHFEDVILNELAQTRVLISILSPGYVNTKESPWCVRELTEFCRIARGNMGVSVGSKSRCIKVIKTPVPREQHPPDLQGMRGIEFFDEDAESGRPRDFSYEPVGYKYNRYRDMVDQVVADVAEVLQAIDNPQAETPADITHTVYLAETTSDRKEHREKIKNELSSRGFWILPDREFGETSAQYRQDVAEDLKRSRLSIHLIGEKYGTRLEDEDEKSIIEIQNELAAQHSSEDPNFSRIIWIAPDLVPSGKSQSAFLELLRTDGDAQRGAELLERPFEELKNRIEEKLTDHTVLQFPREDLLRIYLICDKLDFTDALAVRDYLFDKEYEVILPPREGDSTQVIQDHKETLLECDATLIYCGNGGEIWFRSKLTDLLKAPGWGRNRPLLAKGIYLASPEQDYKEYIKTRQAKLLEPPGYAALSERALEDFITDLEAARVAQVNTGTGGLR